MTKRPPGSREATPALERFRAVLRRRGQRWTSERRAIVEALLDRPGHFSIDGLVRELQAEGVPVSRATVYRTLPLLVEAGLAQPTVLPSDERRYESGFGKAHHDHLVCTRCGKVIEFQFEAFEMLQEALAARHGFKLLGHVHELFGFCADCRSREAD